MASAPSSANLLSRISRLFSRSEGQVQRLPLEASLNPAQRLASVMGEASPPLTGGSAALDKEADGAVLENYERELGHQAGEHFLSDEQEQEAMNDFWEGNKAGEFFLKNEEEQQAKNDVFIKNPVQTSFTTEAAPLPTLPKSPEEFAKFIDDHAEPAALAVFQKQFRAIGVADITVLSGQTVSASKHHGDVSYNIRPATMDELRPEIAKAAASGRLPTPDPTVARQGGTVTLDEGRQPTTPRPIDLSQRSEMMKDAAAKFLRRREIEGRADASLGKNHKAIVEDFLAQNATPAQVADFQQQLDTQGSATLTLVTAQTITATRINGPKDLPSMRYDIRPATREEYQPHLEAVQSKLSAGKNLREATKLPESLGRGVQETAQSKIDKQPVAVLLTGEQARLLIADAHPNDAPAQARALYSITNTAEAVSILEGSVSLDYSDDAQGYFAVMDENTKPALDQKLIQLQTREDQKYQSPQQRQSSQRRGRDDDYERD